jgi:hypothetical protein
LCERVAAVPGTAIALVVSACVCSTDKGVLTVPRPEVSSCPHRFGRFRDTAGDDRFADRALLQSFDYRSRYGHGQNEIVLGPDDMLSLVIGNDVSFPPLR